MSTSRKALFLDRDGTIIEHIPYLHDPEQVKLLPGAREALQCALRQGFNLFLFTNQSGVGRGMFEMSDADACNRKMLELLDLPGPGFTQICVAPEAPGDPVRYRKPNPRFIHEMINEYALDAHLCWMIGDSSCDSDAAANAGIKGIQLGEMDSLERAVARIIETRATL